MSLFNRIRTLADATAKQAFKEYTEQALKDTCLGQVDGISICDLSNWGSGHTKAFSLFLVLTEEALALIKSFDPKRYRRVCRHLKYVVNLELISAGNFSEKYKMCCVDYGRFFTSSSHEWNVRRYARLLVHEATHGVLEEKLILYTKDKRQRIEGLCHLEEYRFAKHFGHDWADTYIGTFNPERWKLYWEGTFQERLAAHWKSFMARRPPS